MVKTIEQTARIECWPRPIAHTSEIADGSYRIVANGSAAADSEEMEDSVDGHLTFCEQVAAALTLCSDIQLLLDQKYDPSAQLDRSASNIFPSDYCCSLLSRVGCGARGVGALERRQRGKDRGGKAPFQPIYRPVAFDLQSNRARIESNLRALREEMVPSVRSVSAGSHPLQGIDSQGPPLLYSSTELALSMCPFMQILCQSAFTVGMGVHSGHAASSLGPRVVDRLGALRLLYSKPTHDDYAIPRSEGENDFDLHTKVIGTVETIAVGDNAGIGQSAADVAIMEDIESYDD